MSLGGMVCGGMGFKRTSTSFLLLSKSVLRVKMILCVCVWACGHSISSPMAQAVIVTAAVLITEHGSPSKKVIFEFCFLYAEVHHCTHC